jgi:DNA-binding MarR family transcriptional regulator
MILESLAKCWRLATLARFAILACGGRRLYILGMAKSGDSGAPRPAFGLLPDLIGYHLRRAQSAVFQDFAATMGGAGITPGQFGVLALIEANSGLSQTRLAQILGIDRSTLVAVIDKLEHQGLVERAARPNDRRSHALRLSDVGKARYQAWAQQVRRHERRIAKRLSPQERKTLIRLLQRIG